MRRGDYFSCLECDREWQQQKQAQEDRKTKQIAEAKEILGWEGVSMDNVTPQTVGYMQRIGAERCCRCRFVTDESKSFEEQDAEMHAHLDAVHPGWLTDGINARGSVGVTDTNVEETYRSELRRLSQGLQGGSIVAMEDKGLKFTGALVLTGRGADEIILTSNLPAAITHDGGNFASLRTEATAGTGAQWVRENIGIEPEVIKLSSI